MNLTSDLFAAFLKCPTKCHLLSLGETGTGNEYANWVKAQAESYRAEAVERLRRETPQDHYVVSAPVDDLKAAKWRLAVDVEARTEGMEAQVHAVERVPKAGRGKAAALIPIYFVPNNKLSKDDKLLLAFDALVMSQVLGREIATGKIIHGDDHAANKVNTAGLAGQVRKQAEKAASLVSDKSPPDLILNRHCAECEYRYRCRQKAIEKDDLSLLSNMSEKERRKFNNEGIFTVTQLSYTFRPRRRPKRLRDKHEKYHHSLKALAIREKKIHIVGTPELKIDSTPAYLDVEGLPDRDFYYLIGVRVKIADAVVQHSFWADDFEGEKKAWTDFLAVLDATENPMLIHYGSYETTFLRRMRERYGGPQEGSSTANAIESAINLIPIIYAQIYFPAYSNSLKDIAGNLGFVWSASDPSGLTAVLWRESWEINRSSSVKNKLVTYNAEDCQALETVTSAIASLGSPSVPHQDNCPECSVVNTGLMPRETLFARFSSPIAAFEQINKAARWDYQRDRIYVRSSKRIRKSRDRARHPKKPDQVNKSVALPDRPLCPNCGTKGCRHLIVTKVVLHDLFFGRNSLKKWVVEYRFRYHWCRTCQIRFGLPREFWPETNFGRNLVGYVVYQIIELYIAQLTIQRSLARLFGYDFKATAQVSKLKAIAADFYTETQRLILKRIVNGSLVQIDETRANVRGKTA